MADVPVTKKTLKQIFQESAQFDRKLTFQGPETIRPDSRYAITEIAEDFVAFRLLGDEQLLIPYASVTNLKVAATQLTIRYR
jgi:hypothetical protein